MMIQNQLRQEILHEIDRLPDERQHRALRLIRGLATPRGASVEALLPYFGCIDDESAKEMTMAIEEERPDLSEQVVFGPSQRSKS